MAYTKYETEVNADGDPVSPDYREQLARIEQKVDTALAILEELAPFARRAAVLMNNSRGFKIAELVARGRK